jgi:hypothetical protein
MSKAKPFLSIDKAVAALASRLTNGVSDHALAGATIVGVGKVDPRSIEMFQSAMTKTAGEATDSFVVACNAALDRADKVVDFKSAFERRVAAGQSGPAPTETGEVVQLRGTTRYRASELAREARRQASAAASHAAVSAVGSLREERQRLAGLEQFFDGAVVGPVGNVTPENDAKGMKRFMGLAQRLAAVGLLTSIALGISTGGADAWTRPNGAPAPAAAQVRGAAPVAVQRSQAQVAAPRFAAPVQQSTPQGSQGTPNWHNGQNGLNNQNGQVSPNWQNEQNRHGRPNVGAFVAGMVAGAVVGNVVGNGLTPAPIYNGYGQRPQGLQSYGAPNDRGGYAMPDQRLIIAGRAITAVGLNSVVQGRAQFDRAMAAGIQCMRISQGTRPCRVQLPNVQFDFAQSRYYVGSGGVAIATQAGGRVEINPAGFRQAIAMAREVGQAEFSRANDQQDPSVVPGSYEPEQVPGPAGY